MCPRRLPLSFTLATILVTTSAFAQDAPRSPGSVAMLVTETGDDGVAAIAAALMDEDSRVRAAAARVANVRKLTELLPNLRDVVRSETNLEAAREQLRAIGMIGGPAEIDFLIEEAERLGHAFRSEVLVAMARADGAEALRAYYSKVQPRGWSGVPLEPFMRAALWGNPGLVTPTAARALGVGDEAAWRAVLAQLQPPLVLDVSLAAVALLSNSEAIAAETAWYLATFLSDRKDPVPEELLTALDEADARASTSPDLIAGRRILSRVLGRLDHAGEPWLRELVSAGKAWRFAHVQFDVIERAGDYVTDGAVVCGSSSLLRLLSRDEARIVCQEEKEKKEEKKKKGRVPHPSPGTSVDVTPAPFDLVIDLPKGVAADVVARTSCRADWIGNVSAAVDRSGRVTRFSLDGVHTSPECRQTLEVLLPLTLAMNKSITSRSSTAGAIVVKSQKSHICVDEADVDPDRYLSGAHRVGGQVEPPIVVHRVSPEWSFASRHNLQGTRNSVVIIESRISESGCVNPLTVLRASTSGDLNRSALLSLVQWRFKPATLDGKPVPVIFNLTVNFILNP